MDRDEVVCIIFVRSDQLVATSRAEFIGDQVGCTRHSLIWRLTRLRNHIHNKIPSYRGLRRHGPLVRGDMRALVFDLAKVFDGILLCRKCGSSGTFEKNV